LRRAGASEVVAVVPYLGYSRQDRQIETGDAVTSHFVVGALAAAGADRIVTVDVHSESSISASPVPVVNVNPITEMALAVRVSLGERFTIVAPDHGAKHRAERFAAELVTREPAWIEKRRDPKTGKVEIMNIHGDLQGDTAVIVDDIVDTGSTIALAVAALREKGFSTIHLCVTHPVFSSGAAALLRKLKLGSIVTTNTIDVPEAMTHLPGMHAVDISRMIADAVRG
jgi:ribose-phosphate pyrophosphokinase